ncbi:MAG: LL-diaminopimelate aminotransferase [Methanobrevibacter sp.]|nr:LL-diaminopimelate aminotransferase [Methanobrevibacter sp.]
MININENYLKLENSYLFSTIAKKIEEYQENNPKTEIIKLGIGDVTLPIVPTVVNAVKTAMDEMGDVDKLMGYGPEQGYDFLRERIAKIDYEKKGINVTLDEIFVSDGSKSDTGNIGDIFSIANTVAITDPIYPVYLDTNIMAGRKIVYMPSTSENNFVPDLPEEKADMIYLCSPNNPTGEVLKKEELKVWVDYALENKSIILFDGAYESFITEDNIPHSIYEIERAKEVAIEFRSFSKTAGFTGLRCAYTVVPKELKAYTKSGKKVSINSLWNRRQTTKFNGVPYIIQKGAEAIYSDKGQKEIKDNISYYLENARIIREGLANAGYTVFGGINAPYIWLKVPDNLGSWEFFDKLLHEKGIVGTPGSGFGPNGEGYFRLTAFASRKNTIEAINRIKS